MFAALLAVTVTAAPTDTIAPLSPVHLGLVFKLTHSTELDALLQAQQDPGSPDFRRWLTPDEFGRRFGQPEAVLARPLRWWRANGFQDPAHPDRLFGEGN